MNIDASTIKWPPITEEGHRMLRKVREEQIKEVAMKYGAHDLLAKLSPPVAPKPSGRYRLSNIEEVARTQPINWRVKGVIPESGIGAIYGPSASGKTFLAMDMVLTIARGEPWFCLRTKPCPVVYVCLEGDAGLPNRVKAYLTQNDVDGKVLFLTQPVNFLSDKDAPDLAKAIVAAGAENGIVVFDTLNRAAPGMDENSSGDMGRVIAMAKGLQNAVGGLVLFVHHSGKDSTKGMRGHSSLFAAMDAVIEVCRNGDQREWKNEKVKDGKDGSAHPFKLEVIELGIDEDGDPITSCVIKQDGNTGQPRRKPISGGLKQGMDAFHLAVQKTKQAQDFHWGAHVDDWRAEFNTISTADTPDGKKKAFQRCRSQLVEMGYLTVQDDVYCIPRTFEQSAGHGT
jgi:hypothetical protein